ncbi:hypothetical protein KUCAC02_025819, partial [Chaenocephalus aceratus]
QTLGCATRLTLPTCSLARLQTQSRSLCSIKLSLEPSLSAIRNPRVQLTVFTKKLLPQVESPGGVRALARLRIFGLTGGRAKPGCSAVRIDPCGRLVPPEGINQSPCCLGKSTPYQIFTASSPCDFSQYEQAPTRAVIGRLLQDFSQPPLLLDPP